MRVAIPQAPQAGQEVQVQGPRHRWGRQRGPLPREVQVQGGSIAGALIRCRLAMRASPRGAQRTTDVSDLGLVRSGGSMILTSAGALGVLLSREAVAQTPDGLLRARLDPR